MITRMIRGITGLYHGIANQGTVKNISKNIHGELIRSRGIKIPKYSPFTNWSPVILHIDILLGLKFAV